MSFRRTRVEPVSELRRICQDPVRYKNDLTGSLYGWRISIHITRLLLSFGLSASVASVAMVVCGVVGSALCLFGGHGIPLGLFLLSFAYVLDCVDGEMARYQRIDSLRWAALDYLHHMLTKALAFCCLGIGLFVEYGMPWTMAAGGVGSACWLLLMGIRDLPAALFAKKLVQCDDPDRNPAYRRFVEHLAHVETESADPDPREDPWGRDFRFRPWVIRTFFTSFDVAVLLLFLASVADLFLPAFAWFGVGPLGATSAGLFLYAALLPLHTVEVVYDAFAGGGLKRELYRIAARARRFRDRASR